MKTAKIINWVCLTLGVVSVAGLYAYNPRLVGFANFLTLLPYGLALIAFRRDTRKVAAWFAVIFNLIYGTLFAALVVLGMMGKTGSPVLAAAVGLLLGGPCGLNVRFLIKKIREVPANNSLQPTGYAGG